MIRLWLALLLAWTTTAENKTKRTLSQELYNYGETAPVLPYNENLNPKPVAYYNLPQPIKVYEPPYTPKPQNQQVLYEYQQNPSNIVYAKQPLNPNYNFQNQRYQEPAPTTTLQSFTPSEAVVLPVQNPPFYESNGQFPPNIKLNQFHNGQVIPRKVYNPNGRLIFNQNQAAPYAQPNINREPLFPSQQILPNSYYNSHQFQQRPERPTILDYNNNYTPRQNIIAPNIASKINSHRRHPVQSRPKVAVNKEEESRKTSDDVVKSVEDADEDNLEENDSSEQQEQDPAYSKYTFDYEENESSTEAEDYEEKDTKKDAKKRRQGSKKENENGERHRDSKRTRAEPDKASRKPKMTYKVKYSRELNRSPKGDYLEGRHTENVPVTHKHRFFKEKWYLSKNTENHQDAK